MGIIYVARVGVVLAAPAWSTKNLARGARRLEESEAVAMVLALLLIPTASNARPLARRLEGCDVRYLECLQDMRSSLRRRADGRQETEAEHAAAMYGCCPALRQRVASEVLEVFRGADRMEPVVIVTLSKWWWAARLAAFALDGAGHEDLTLLAFSPILSLDPRDHADRAGMAPSHVRVLEQWAGSPMVQSVHGERLVVPPECRLTVVYPRLHEPDRRQLEAPDVTAWLRCRPNTTVVPLACGVHSNVFLFVPSIELRDGRVFYVNESEQRTLSDDEVRFVRALRAHGGGALHLDRAILDHASFAAALQAFAAA